MSNENEEKSTVLFSNHVMSKMGFKENARFPIFGYGFSKLNKFLLKLLDDHSHYCCRMTLKGLD